MTQNNESSSASGEFAEPSMPIASEMMESGSFGLAELEAAELEGVPLDDVEFKPTRKLNLPESRPVTGKTASSACGQSRLCQGTACWSSVPADHRRAVRSLRLSAGLGLIHARDIVELQPVRPGWFRLNLAVLNQTPVRLCASLDAHDRPTNTTHESLITQALMCLLD